MKIKKILFFALVVFFNGCAFSQPDSSEIIKNVKKHYKQISLADGSPTYEVENIKIEEVKKSQNDTFLVKVTVNGTYENLSIPDQEQKEHDFENKHTFIFYKNTYQQWECKLKYD
ncbi:MAG: hypothetical protein HUU47_01660 [Bacteroidetes bacterium]|nr:hypothetical protein [Bacteroidota bacterium]